MLHYILQTIIFQLLFLMVYDVFLKNETFFNWNRFYLLTSALLSVILPFVKIDGFKTIIPQKYIFSLPEVIIGNNTSNVITLNEVFLNTQKATLYFSFNWSYILYLGSCIAIILFLIKLYKIAIIAYKNPKVKFEKALLIELSNSKHAFSFFNYIFIGKDINTEDKQTILAHELEHVKEKHSIDLLFFEILKIVFWFNPLIYLYQNRIADLHEFVADAKAVKSSSKTNYYQNLLSQVFDTQKVSFINSFFKQSLIKKRIIMLSKSKSKQIHLAKYLLVFPMVIGMLFYTSCSNEDKLSNSVEETSNLSEEELLKKYIEEINELKTNNILFSLDDKAFEKFNLSIVNDNYIQTLDQYLRSKAFLSGVFTDLINKESVSDKSSFKLALNDLESSTYQDYLERKKTQESIDNWENSPRDYQLRKHVKDLDNITEEENKLIRSQIKQIENDDYLHTLIISDGLRHKKSEFKVNNNDEEYIGENMSFVTIDQVPVFNGCDTSMSNNDQRKCFSDKINAIVRENFDASLGKKLNLVGKVRIYARFTINKEGNIANIKTRAPHAELEKEARRVVQLIPQVIPGKHEGELVNVTFDLPITFNIEE
ncbi:TonB-like protein [Lacinutrix venerupis]|uniref:M56 family metallopeptidase n=1 Tax=Lacinutrix venerupis TaxID=1486034 RepID=UPI000F1031DF|nr:M56 family metallopeptidase [Lacinutrix venerupis]RLJ65679.1 TonB-like protein [Lacinutrix venerupis]